MKCTRRSLKVWYTSKASSENAFGQRSFPIFCIRLPWPQFSSAWWTRSRYLDPTLFHHVYTLLSQHPIHQTYLTEEFASRWLLSVWYYKFEASFCRNKQVGTVIVRNKYGIQEQSHVGVLFQPGRPVIINRNRRVVIHSSFAAYIHFSTASSSAPPNIYSDKVL